MSPTGLGRVNRLVTGLVFLRATWVVITLEVPSDRPAWVPWKAPAAMAPAWVSLMPDRTGVDGGQAQQLGHRGRSGPTSLPTGTSSGSLAGSISDCSTSVGSQVVAPGPGCRSAAS